MRMLFGLLGLLGLAACSPAPYPVSGSEAADLSWQNSGTGPFSSYNSPVLQDRGFSTLQPGMDAPHDRPGRPR